MNTRISLLLGLIVCVSAAAAWSQDVPPPLPCRSLARLRPRMSPPASPTGTAPYYPPGSYSPPPGAAMVVPGQPYPYPYPSPYGGPVVMSPPVAIPGAAPPLPTYEWAR